MASHRSAIIALDVYKLDAIKQRLNEGGFVYEEVSVLSSGIVTLKVTYAEDELPALAELIRTANVEAARRRTH